MASSWILSYRLIFLSSSESCSARIEKLSVCSSSAPTIVSIPIGIFSESSGRAIKDLPESPRYGTKGWLLSMGDFSNIISFRAKTASARICSNSPEGPLRISLEAGFPKDGLRIS